MPDGERIKEITPTDISINCISVNPQGALVAAGLWLFLFEEHFKLSTSGIYRYYT